MYEKPDENMQIHENVYLFSTFRRLMAEKSPLFLDFANSHLRLQISPFFAKVGTSVVYVLVGSWGAGDLDLSFQFVVNPNKYVQDCDVLQLAVVILSILNTLRPRQYGRHFPDDILETHFL